MKHIATTLCVMITFFMTYTNSFAQLGIGKAADVLAIKSRPLIVIIEEPDQKVIDKLNKKGKGNYVDDYKKAISDYNDNMKDAVDKYWTYSKSVEYKTNGEMEALIKKGSKSYAVMRCVTEAEKMGGTEVEAYRGIKWTYTDFKNGEKEDNDFWKSITILGISLIEKSGNSGPYTPVYFLGLQDIFPLESDIIFGVRGMQWYFSQREHKASKGDMRDMIKDNAPQLKGKTLIVRKDRIDPKLTMETIKSVYPYKIEFDEKDVFDQHLINGDDGYAVLEVTPSYQYGSNRVYLTYTYFALDVNSGDILGYVLPPAMGGLFSGGSGKTVNERTFKDLGEEAVGK